VLHVQDLAESFATTALATPIIVQPAEHKAACQWTLAAGFHRVGVAKRNASGKP